MSTDKVGQVDGAVLSRTLLPDVKEKPLSNVSQIQ